MLVSLILTNGISLLCSLKVPFYHLLYFNKRELKRQDSQHLHQCPLTPILHPLSIWSIHLDSIFSTLCRIVFLIRPSRLSLLDSKLFVTWVFCNWVQVFRSCGLVFAPEMSAAVQQLVRDELA